MCYKNAAAAADFIYPVSHKETMNIHNILLRLECVRHLKFSKFAILVK